MDRRIGKPGEIVRVRPLADGQETHQISLLIKSSNVRISQVIIPAGQTIPTYEAEGEIVLHCLQGRLLLTALEETHELKGNELLYLSINEPFSTEAIENSTLLVIVLMPKQGQNVDLIGK